MFANGESRSSLHQPELASQVRKKKRTEKDYSKTYFFVVFVAMNFEANGSDVENTQKNEMCSKFCFKDVRLRGHV